MFDPQATAAYNRNKRFGGGAMFDPTATAAYNEPPKAPNAGNLNPTLQKAHPGLVNDKGETNFSAALPFLGGAAVGVGAVEYFFFDKPIGLSLLIGAAATAGAYAGLRLAAGLHGNLSPEN